jgi:hypothetical protein
MPEAQMFAAEDDARERGRDTLAFGAAFSEQLAIGLQQLLAITAKRGNMTISRDHRGARRAVTKLMDAPRRAITWERRGRRRAQRITARSAPIASAGDHRGARSATTTRGEG